MLAFTPTRVKRFEKSYSADGDNVLVHQLLNRRLRGETYNNLKEEAFSQNINHIQLLFFEGCEKFVQKFKWHCYKNMRREWCQQDGSMEASNARPLTETSIWITIHEWKYLHKT